MMIDKHIDVTKEEGTKFGYTGGMMSLKQQIRIFY
jgi:hypothetical protein